MSSLTVAHFSAYVGLSGGKREEWQCETIKGRHLEHTPRVRFTFYYRLAKLRLSFDLMET